MPWVKRYGWVLLLAAILFTATVVLKLLIPEPGPQIPSAKPTHSFVKWQSPDTSLLGSDSAAVLIRYGRELIANTADYLGPKGKVASISNGMNCQNCHINAGTVPYANCLSAVASTYPMFRPRSGIVESIEFRINDCLQRSLNGSVIDSGGREMRAMVAYLQWIGNTVPKGKMPDGANIKELPYLDRAADTLKGRKVYVSKCVACHGYEGEGRKKDDSASYFYPPLWGMNSYNTGAGLYRLSRFAGYVKSTMPVGATHTNPILTNEEAWDVAAYVNSQPRPVKHFAADWPDLHKKAIDYPFGPYADPFPELQHKYGPFKPILAFRQAASKSDR